MPEFHRVIRPNRSLTPHGLALLFTGIVAVCLTIALGFLLIGAWMVLPFAGLEIAVAGAALAYISRHIGDCEELVVDDGRLFVTQRCGQRELRHEFPCYWARVSLRVGDGWHPSRLVLCSHGRELEIGASINEEQRHSLARELRTIVGFAYK
jgi:uncharacterized membrane protein